MKRFVFVAVLVVAMLAAGAVAAFASPGEPGRGFGMMGQGGYGHMGGPGMMAGRTMMCEDLEELLGISHAEIHAAHVAGRSLVEIAAEKGVSEDQVIQTLLDGRKAALGRAVEAGRLTQGAADQMLTFMETNIKAMVEAEGMSGMMGLMGGAMSGMMGRTGGCHGGQPPAQQGTGAGNGVRLAPRWLQQG
jgi:hypothetical protein